MLNLVGLTLALAFGATIPAPSSSAAGAGLVPAPAPALARGAEPSWASLLEGLTCEREVASRLEAWDAASEAFRAPAALNGAERFRLPTSRRGFWITLETGPGSRARLFRTTPSSGLEVTFDASCRAAERESASNPGVPGALGFSDADLEAALGTNDTVVVYLWTPHLPLSVEGYHQVAEAAAAVGASLVAVVDPSAEADYVREVADAEGIPSGARRPLASVELLFRNLAVHAPAILVFEAGRARPVLPGYRSAEAYIDYLEGG